MAVRFDALADSLSRSANLPSITAFTISGWAQVVSDQGAAVPQPLVSLFDAGTTDGIVWFWENNPDGSASIAIFHLGAVVGGFTFGSRPAVGTDFFFYLKCSGTGSNQVEAGWRASGSNTFVTGTATLGTSVTAPTALTYGAQLGSFYTDMRLWNAKAWDRALSASELVNESFYERVVFPSSLNFHWRLRNATDTVDRGANGRNATVAGTLTTEDEFALWVPAKKRFVLRVPAANNTISVPAGALTIAGHAPTVTATANNFVAVPLATLTLAANAPTVVQTANQTVSVPAGSLTLNGLAPTVEATQGNYLDIPVGSLALTGFAPSVLQTANQVVEVPAGSLTFSGFAPTVAATAHNLIDVPTGTLTLTGIAPAVLAGGPQVIDVPLGVLSITAYAPQVAVSEQASGGYFVSFELELERRRRRRKKELEELEEAQELADEIDREIAVLLQKQAADEAENRDFERLTRLAAEFADRQAEEQMSARLARAIAQVNRTKSAESLARLELEVERQLREEEEALVFLLNE